VPTSPSTSPSPAAPALAGSVGATPAGLEPVQAEFIALFVAAAEVLGVPRSLGEIYGVVYASPRPLSFQDIVDRLAISKGSVSQGLRMLKSLGAIRAAYVPGDRRDHYEPETELRTLVGGLLRDRINPHLEQGRQRLDRVGAEIAAGKGLPKAEAAVLRARVQKLENWRRKGATLLPILTRVLS
jgi:HTH-type transcriptional regulator, glycine betaine synthesis regulator